MLLILFKSLGDVPILPRTINLIGVDSTAKTLIGVDSTAQGIIGVDTTNKQITGEV